MSSRVYLTIAFATALVFGGAISPVRGQRAPRPTTTRSARQFQHSTKQHQEGKYSSCVACHKIPTDNWTAARRDKESPFPDVVDYPGHAACYGCHDQFSKREMLCAGCHTGRLFTRATHPFPLKSRQRQFTTIYPHGKHESMIARVLRERNVGAAHLINASFVLSGSTEMNVVAEVTGSASCRSCHHTADAMPLQLITPAEVAAQQQFATDEALATARKTNPAKPTADFFKTSPTTHAACFTCHYERIKPVRSDCKGCHEGPVTPYVGMPLPRHSLKFSHEQTKKDATAEKVHYNNGDCASCHLSVTGDPAPNGRQGSVPFSTCADCHKKDASAEFDKRFEQKKQFVCTYCHTPIIGAREQPESHKVQ